MFLIKYDSVFEFFIVSITGGVTSPQLAQLRSGQRCYMEPAITGNFIPHHLPLKATSELWMMGTGTGIAPYLSMLKYAEPILKQVQNIILVHSVRSTAHLCYQQEILHKAINGAHLIRCNICRWSCGRRICKCSSGTKLEAWGLGMVFLKRLQ